MEFALVQLVLHEQKRGIKVVNTAIPCSVNDRAFFKNRNTGTVRVVLGQTRLTGPPTSLDVVVCSPRIYSKIFFGWMRS